MAVPVYLFSFLDRFLSSHRDTAGASDKGIRKVLYRLHLFRLQWLIVPQFVETSLQIRVVDALNSHLFEVQPKYTMDVSSPPALEFYPVTYVPHLHRVIPAKDHIPSEGLHPVLEVTGGQEDISPDQLVLRLVHMLLKVLLPRKVDNRVTHFNFHRDVGLTKLVHLVVYCAAQLLEDRSEVGAPTHVTAGQSEEDVERPDVLQLGDDVVPDLLPVLWGPWELFKDCAGIVEVHSPLTIRSQGSPAPHTSEVGVSSQPLRFYDRHSCKVEPRRLGKSVVNIENPLLEVVLTRQLHSSLVVQAEFTIRKESWPALDVPVLYIRRVLRLLPFARSKVELGNLFTLVVEEDLGMTVDEGAVLAVLEMLSPHRIVLNVLFFCVQSLLHVVLPLLFFVGISHGLVCQLCELLLPPFQFLDFFFKVILNLFPIQQAELLDATPFLIFFFVVVKLVVGVFSFGQVLECLEDLTRPDVLLLFSRLVLLLTLQLDGYQSSLSFVGQPRQLFDRIHDIIGLNGYADHSSLPRSPARLLQQDHLLKIDVVGDHVIL